MGCCGRQSSDGGCGAAGAGFPSCPQASDARSSTAQQVQQRYEAWEASLEQLNRMRETVSGVSLDEEMAQLIQYQRAFEASARLIRVADEMLQTILEML